VISVFGDDARSLREVAQVFELMEMAWHDCYEEITPPEAVIDDIVLCSRGTLGGLVDAAHLAVIDRRDLSLRASEIRSESLDRSA